MKKKPARPGDLGSALTNTYSSKNKFNQRSLRRGARNWRKSSR